MDNRSPSNGNLTQSPEYQNAIQYLLARGLATSENILLLNGFADPYLGLAEILVKSSHLLNRKNLKLVTDRLKVVSIPLITILEKLDQDQVTDALINKIASLDNDNIYFLARIAKLLEKKFAAYKHYLFNIIQSDDPPILMSVISQFETIDCQSKGKTSLLSEKILEKLFSENGWDYAIALTVLSLLDLAYLAQAKNILAIMENNPLDNDCRHSLEKFLMTLAMSVDSYQWLRIYNVFEITSRLHLTSEKFDDFYQSIDFKSLKTFEDLNAIIKDYFKEYPEQILELCHIYDKNYLEKLSDETLQFLNIKRLAKTTDGKLINAFMDYKRLKGGAPFPNDIVDGICFGTALCHGIFNTIGKELWWKAVCEAVVQWDGNLQSLSNLIYLPDANEPFTLDFLIQMAGEFILKHETIDLTATKFELAVNEKQRELLKPGGPIQIITTSGTKKIQDQLTLVLSGDEDLETFIEKFKSCHNNDEVFCLIHRRLHTCALHSENGIYFFNGNRGKSGPIADVSKIWQKTRQTGPKVMGIDVISLNGKIDPELVTLSEAITNNAIKKINPVQFKTFIKVMPNRLTQLLKEVAANNDLEILFAEALAFEGPTFINNLRSLVIDAPEALSLLLDLLDHKPGLQNSFIKAFSTINNSITVFELIIHYAPSTLPKLFELAQILPDLEACLEQALLNNVQGMTAFYRILSCAPEQIPAFLNLLKNSEKLKNSVAKTIQASPKGTTTSLHILALQEPNYFAEFLSVMRENTTFIKSFSSLLETKNDVCYPTWPLLHLIIKNSSDCLPQLIRVAKRDKAMMQAIHRVMALEVTIEWADGSHSTKNGFELIKHFASDYKTEFDELFALATPPISNINTLFLQKNSPANPDFSIQKQASSYNAIR